MYNENQGIQNNIKSYSSCGRNKDTETEVQLRNE